MANQILFFIISISIGLAFFLAETFKAYRKINIHISLIAGISLAYFFFVVLPKIELNFPEDSIFAHSFEYIFVLIGFSLNHIIEKLILQKVESNAQNHARELIRMEKDLDLVERNLENTIDNELMKEDLDKWVLKELAETVMRLKKEEKRIKENLELEEKKIKIHISKNIDELRFFSDYIYHLLIGLLVINFFLISIISGIMVSIIALFVQMVSKSEERDIPFSDMDIEIEFKQTKIKKYLSSTSTITGVFLGIILDSIFGLNLEFTLILYSFISGVIMYTIIRDVIPEKEKGKPLLFIIGIVGFGIFLLLLNVLEHTLHFLQFEI